MKKNIFIIFLLVTIFFGQISNAKTKNKKWDKITNYIYIDKHSIIKSNNIVSAWFKIYNSPDNEIHKINNTPIHYEINRYEIKCSNPKTISIANSKSYDINNNLINEYINKEGYACSYPCLINDNIYVEELCLK